MQLPVKHLFNQPLAIIINLPPMIYNEYDLMSREELTSWHFEQLKKHLITLSAPAQKQIEIIGQEMAGVCLEADYTINYLDHRTDYLNSGILNEYQVKVLDSLNLFFKERSCKNETDKFYDFWTVNEQLYSHPDWEEVRIIAKKCADIL